MNPLFPDYTLYSHDVTSRPYSDSVVNAVRTFCGAFKTAGFKLVVFADGNPPNAKMVHILSPSPTQAAQETVVERREQIIAVCATVYENFGNGAMAPVHSPRIC